MKDQTTNGPAPTPAVPDPDAAPDDLIPTKDACKLLVSPRTGKPVHPSCLVRLALSGKVRAWRRGAWWFFSRAEIAGLTERVLLEPLPRQQRQRVVKTSAWSKRVLREAGYDI